MTRILLSGATGFIGRALSIRLEKRGYTVIKLCRGEGTDPGAIYWNPDKGKAVTRDFEGFDGVIHLGGEPLTLGRWSKKKREKIFTSRALGTRLLSEILHRTIDAPKVFISASAVGFYGDRGEERLTERSPAGRGFLAHVCCEWEKGSRLLENRGIRTVQARFGIVIGAGSQALKKMVFLYKLGLGGKIGTGRQWMSWVDLDDLVSALETVVIQDSLRGPINVVSPNPVRQEEFSKTVSRLLHRPSFFALPAWLLRFGLGSVADEMLLASIRAEPEKLLASHFTFQTAHLIDALRKALQIC